MWWRLPHNPTAYDDDWEDQPGQGPVYQWGLGGLVPLLVLGYGVYAVAARQAEYGRIPMKLHGVNAVAFGTAAISAAVFLHCHYFWGNVYNQAWFAVLGKIVAACGFIAGLATLIVRVGVLGIH
jgi:hypothetical protein